MSVKGMVRCNCGQRILARDVLSTGYELRPAGPHYVYVKFRCPHCRRLGEHLVEQSKWDWSVLRPGQAGMAPREEHRFPTLSPITVEEMLEFHFSLESPDALKLLK
jgi:hypothetical protein